MAQPEFFSTPSLETERLSLRPLQAGDAPAIFQCWMQDEEVSRYMYWKASPDPAAAEAFVRFELAQLPDPQWYRWLLEEKSSGQLVGTCLIYYNKEESPAHWDISYNLGRTFRGQGYTTEAMRRVLRFAEQELGMTECITSYAKCNHASAAVLHKLGFADEAEIPYECSGGELLTEGVRCRYQSPSRG